METKDLEFALKIAQPCLLAVEFIPILTHFCFEDGQIYAYDGVSATLVACDTDLHCALHGNTLIGAVGLAGPTITLKKDKANVSVQSGRSIVKLPCLEPSDFTFRMPEQDVITSFNMSDDLKHGLQLCTGCVGKDPRKPEFTGITLQLGKEAILYASDNTSINKYVLKEGIGKKTHTILIPKSICDQILAVATALELEMTKIEVSVTEEYLMIVYDAEPQVTIIGKMLDATPPAYEKMIKACTTDNKRFKIPPDFDKAVAKVSLVVSKEAQKDCMLSTKKKEFAVFGAGGLGEADTVFEVDESFPEVEAKCSPEHLTKVLGDVTHISVAETIVQMEGEQLAYYVSTRT